MTLNISTLGRFLALALLAGCGANGQSGHQANGGSTVQNSSIAKLSLTSDAFLEGQPIPAQYTCDGVDRRPVLHWSEPPGKTRSFALVIDDPAAPGGTFRHWGIFDIPSSARSIGEGQKIGTEADNDFGKSGYGGPCPPKGHGPHHYHFRLFALDVDRLGVPPKARVADVERAAEHHVIAKGELIGTYERK